MAVEEGGSLGPYRLLRRLGGGGAGEVYLADGPAGVPGGPGPVALKVIAGPAADPTVQFIARSAQAVGRLQQPHIIPFYGVVEDLDRLATVMAFAGGGSLGDNLQTQRAGVHHALGLPLGTPIVARLISQIAAALEVAHGAGLVHGDLKPTNVFVRTSPTGHPLAAVSDFGQSVIVGAAASILAGQPSGSSPGTSAWAVSQLLFAAPEQLDGPAAPASDQYGLAALAYLLLTGVPPVVGSGYALLHAIRAGSAAAPSTQNPALGLATDETLLRALSPDPSQRFPTLALFGEALRNNLATSSATGVTSQFAMLAGEGYGQAGQEGVLQVYGPVEDAERGSASPSQSSLRSRVGSRWPGRKPRLAGVPDPSPTINKRLAIMTSAALLIAVLSCVLAVQVINGTSFLPHIVLGNGSSAVATPILPTPDAGQQRVAAQAAQDLQLATRTGPIIADSLTNNNEHWRTSDKTLYFAADGFHISTVSTGTAVGDDSPGKLTSPANEVVQVDMKFTVSQAGNFAGLRFFVTQNRDGTQNYYCFLISTDGRFALWEYQGDNQTPWTFIATGYSNSINAGLDQMNRMTVLALGSGPQRRVLYFANGQYVTQASMVGSSIDTSGGNGLMVFDDNTEAVFSNFAVYNAGNLS